MREDAWASRRHRRSCGEPPDGPPSSRREAGRLSSKVESHAGLVDEPRAADAILTAIVCMLQRPEVDTGLREEKGKLHVGFLPLGNRRGDLSHPADPSPRTRLGRLRDARRYGPTAFVPARACTCRA